jgi:hypothetical protein
MESSEIVVTEILKFLPQNDRSVAGRINQRWFQSASSVSAWIGNMPLTASYDGGWTLPSPKIAMRMVQRSHEEPLCAAVRQLRRAAENKEPLGSEIHAAIEASLAGIANLHEIHFTSSRSADIRALQRKQHFLNRYFPTLLWVLLCAELPQQLHIRKSRGDEAEDETPIGLWDLCFSFIATPELPSEELTSDLEVLRAIITVFHYFRVSSIAIGLFLQKADVFDAPLWYFITCLDALRLRHRNELPQKVNIERKVVRNTLESTLGTVDCIQTACSDALRLWMCDEDTSTRLTNVVRQLSSLRSRVERELLSWV